MIKKLMACIREYKRPTLLTFLFIVGEVIIECLIPFITANLVNQMKADMEMKTLLTIGISLVVMALVSLCCGGLAGYTSAKASAGFAKNLRHDLFDKIQNFSFQNIDKFSSSSLVTRLTTDVSNVQMSYMMLIRTAIRSPLMFIFSIIMAYIMGGALATTFVVVIPVLTVGLILVTRKAMPAFRSVFKKYDKLNESIEENVRAMRVVKGFAREDYEIQKFGKAAGDICADFTKAERIVAFNNPLMQACLYFNMLFVLTIGSKLVIESMGASLDVGQISSMLTYGMQILMSLMMISMIYVMVTMSFESMKRIDEVLSEVMPQDKAKKVKEIMDKVETVAMVGDGINDAPALAQANVGVAIGSGTDVAIESADVVLVKSDIHDVLTAILLSRATIRNIRQNLFWAFCYNTIGIPIAAGILYLFGGPLLNPMFAAAAMSLSSVSVVLNALRLNTFKVKE